MNEPKHIIAIERKTFDILRSLTPANIFTSGFEDREDGRVNIEVTSNTFLRLLPEATEAGGFDKPILRLMKNNHGEDE